MRQHENESSSDSRGAWPHFARLAVFFAIVAMLQWSWSAAAGTIVETLVIGEATVKPAAYLINYLTPEVGARADAWSIRAPGGGLTINIGCDGMETAFLLIAAFTVAPIAWRTRLIGLAFGVPLVYVFNQLRILALFYVNRLDKSLFDLLHTMVLPVVLIILCTIYFYAWLEYDARRAARQP